MQPWEGPSGARANWRAGAMLCGIVGLVSAMAAAIAAEPHPPALLVRTAHTSSDADTIPAQAVMTLSVTPTEGAPYTEVAFTGDGCTGSAAGISIRIVAADRARYVGTATPDVDGDWAATIVVPPVFVAGRVSLDVTCHTTTTEQPYLSQHFEILPGAVATMAVEPVSLVGTGGRAEVTGTQCRYANAPSVDWSLEEPFHGERSDWARIIGGVATPDATGSWSADVDVPTGQPATFRVSATCRETDARSGWRAFEYDPTFVHVRDTFHVDRPVPGALATSPLQVSGRIEGAWEIRADVFDAAGNLLGRTYFPGLGDAGRGLVEFAGAVPFGAPSTPTGSLVLCAHLGQGGCDLATLSIPLRFSPFTG